MTLPNTLLSLQSVLEVIVPQERQETAAAYYARLAAEDAAYRAAEQARWAEVRARMRAEGRGPLFGPEQKRGCNGCVNGETEYCRDSQWCAPDREGE
jgi:hypothetical protein